MSNPLDAIYAKFEAMDNQDVPLEQYPQAAVNALACAGWAVVPRDLPSDVLGEAARNGTMETGNPKHVWDYMISKTRLYPAPKPDSTATGGDVERRARELLAAEYELMGYKALVAGVREFPFAVLSDGDAAAIRAIIAALSAPKQVELDAAYMTGRDEATVINVCDGSCVAPQPVEAEGRGEPAWLVESGDYRQIFTTEATAKAQVWELKKKGYEACITPTVLASPEQPAIDLEQFRPAVEEVKRYGDRLHAEGAFLPEQYDDWMEKADRLLAIIDGAKGERAEGEES